MAITSPAAKVTTAIMKPNKPPTTFLSLPRELRQKILLESYKNDDKSPWKVAPENQQWSASLNSIHPALAIDVDYVQGKSVENMMVIAGQHWCARQPSGKLTMKNEDRALVWTAYWGDAAPWYRVGRTLYLKTHKWWFQGGGFEYWHGALPSPLATVADRQVADEQIFPPWDLQGRARDMHQNSWHETVADWSGGASGVEWDKTGCRHHPSSWDEVRDVTGSPISLQQAADQDIAWLQGQPWNIDPN
ncbi:hypothetical protein Vi05172_g7842 [Venturia inaequalis]|nr:hypothetical protein Vi05172_g7842 [Venturia inaequalis]